MASLPRHQTGKVGVFYILGKPRVKNKDTCGPSADKSDKIYYIMYRLDGKKIEEKVGRESERMTVAKAAKLREQRINGVSLPNTERRRIRAEKAKAEADRWTISKLWEEYKANKTNYKGIVTDENRFANYLQEEFGKLAPEEITTQMVDSLRLRLTKLGRKPATVKGVLELLRRTINFGVKKGLCPWQDPSRLHFEMPKLNNIKTEMLTEDERKRFIEAAKNAVNQKAGQLMLMAYYTGMRRNELFGLKWQHIDFERGFINIVGEGQEGAKSSQDERIPLSQLVRELLQEVERGESLYVFPGKDGVSRLTDINKQVNTIKKAANLPKDFRPLHGLRHTFASVAVSNGVPLSHVQRLLTHKDPSLTQRYAHLEDEALRQAAENVGSFLDISPENEKIHFIQAVSPEEYRMCTDIWLQASVAGHSFIDKEFWRGRQQDMIDKYLPASQVLMAYEDGVPVAFAATTMHVLAALFVLPSRWKNGVGRKLLEQLFSKHDQLDLSVYQKNQRAKIFYKRNGFTAGKEQVCALTGEQEILMHWAR